ncbi:MAG TPA: aldehyde dehydrogenase family protein [Streptosporangiaceae bacterium]
MATTYTSTQLGPEGDALFESGLAAVRAQAGEHRLLIGGQWREGSAGRFEARNPARLTEVTGSYALASDADVADAVAHARRAQQSWRVVPVSERIEILARAASLIGKRSGELAAALCLEVGKNRLESMGEVDEAIELIRYYSRQAADGFDIPLAVPSPDYVNWSVMRPFGVFAVIAPFNFPLALVTGPATAAILAGNTVVAKPSPTTSLVGVLLAEILTEAGLPPGVFNLVTGADETGAALVAAPGIDGIVFTGSYAVGQQIAARFSTAAGYARPCIIEMGGKNPAIVTASADLDGAAEGIARSAFGLSGQKCSACSRVLVDQAVHDDLLDRLAAEAAAWTIGDPADSMSRIGPVHTREAFDRYQRDIREARGDGTVVTGGAVLRSAELDGYYVEPAIVTGLPAEHRLIREEQFVPLLVVERTVSLDDAIRRANDQMYGLTAGLFTGDQDDVAIFCERIEAGTLFVNRAAGATTGGWPGQQTYPGWKGSGSTNRGGLGPRYVQQFLREQGRNICGASRAERGPDGGE